GHESAKWLGRCPGCETWNTLVEERIEAAPKTSAHARRTFRLPSQDKVALSTVSAKKGDAAHAPIPISALQRTDDDRTPTGMKELDRVLGGGLVPGALVLVGGDPGIGKSTLLLHGLDAIVKQRTERRVLYVTGEESLEQVKLRADRLGVSSDRLLL